MELWEYQVIHLNVEAPQSPPATPPPPPRPDDPAAATRPEAVFSREYLEKEFPGFYGNPPAPGQPSQDHPAVQLRGFLNSQGRDGWLLLGFYPVGQLVMMVFRRPLRPDPSAEAVAAQPAVETQAAVPGQTPGSGQTSLNGQSAAAGPPAAAAVSAEASAEATSGAVAAQSPELSAILERLEQLERRLLAETPTRTAGPSASPVAGEQVAAASEQSAAPGGSPAEADPASTGVQKPAAPSGATGGSAAAEPMAGEGGDRGDAPEPEVARSPLQPQLAAMGDGEIVAPELLADLQTLPRFSTAQAARGLGFRSSATLLNRATRSGYQPGLIKHGANGRVAVYIGQERNDRGGRDRRWWVVLAPQT